MAVDMESHVAAKVAALHNIPFAVCRTVIDPAGRDLPPAAVIDLRHDGTPDLLAISGSVIRQPNQIPALVRTARCLDRPQGSALGPAPAGRGA
jgi:hypothetical protein